MADPSEPLTEGTSADSPRSGGDIAEAVEVAERGTAVQEAHDRPGDTSSGQAPVEQSAGDPAMTGGQVVEDPDAGGSEVDGGSASSGAAQAVRGARPIDQT